MLTLSALFHQSNLTKVHLFTMGNPIIPGHPNIKELGFVHAAFFITVEEAQPNTPFHPNEHASIGKTNGSAERITYVSFNVGQMSAYPGATMNSKCFLVPLPTTVDSAGSKPV